MATITITLDVAEELTDPTDKTGLTEEGFEEIFGALQEFGSEIEITRGGVA